MEDPPFRPHVSEMIEKAESLRDLMKRCWRERPDERPQFSEIKNDIEKVLKHNGL